MGVSAAVAHVFGGRGSFHFLFFLVVWLRRGGEDRKLNIDCAHALTLTTGSKQDVTKVAITGLSSVTYIDKVLDASTHTQSTPEVRIAGEVDRVYSAIPQSTTSVVEAGKPRFDVVRDNMADTVVWNPWKEKAAGMGDFAPKDGYLRMVCVEAGAVSQWVKLEAGEAWEGGQVLKSLL